MVIGEMGMNKLVVLFLIGFSVGCGDIKEHDKQLSLFEEGKVSVATWKYSTVKSPVTIVSNKNDFEISVKCVVQSADTGEGESTVWFKKVPPNSEADFCFSDYPGRYPAYYIYSGQELISFIRTKYPIIQVRISKIESREE